MERYTATLVFQTDQGKRHHLRVTDLDPLCGKDDYHSAMQEILESGVLLSVNGVPTSKLAARVTKVVSTEYDVA